ncbi:MAG: ABC transporter permease [Bacteroidota bacterium]
MIRIFDIGFKDLRQLTRDFNTFLFLLLMPVILTVLLGYASGGFSTGGSDSRLPVAYLSEDNNWLTDALHDQLAASEVIRLKEGAARSRADLEKLLADQDVAAAILITDGYGKAVLRDRTARLTLIGDPGSTAWTTIKAEVLAITSRVDGAVRTAAIMDDLAGERMPFRYAFRETLSAWKDPPIAVKETTSQVVQKASGGAMSLGNTSPGIMLQFAIAGLLTASQIIVTERKTRTLQRLLTTATGRVHILLGHYLAIFALIFIQFLLLIAFGQFVLKVQYLRVPLATLLVAVSAGLCISAMGLLIGVLARSEEQAIVFSLVPMFVLAGLGGAWVPLEVTGPTFQTIGHVSPVAWGMDGFKNIAVRGLGFDSVLLPAAALGLYALLFFALAAWRLAASEES